MTRFSALVRRLLTALVLGLLALPSGHALAQSQLFDTVARVDDSIVTRFEVVQRARLLQVLRTPNVTEALALESLIEDRLKQQAARDAGITATEEDIQFGLEDFGARANMTGEEILIALGEAGIEPETVRDYVATLLVWGETVRERFTARARPSEAEIDRALSIGLAGGSTRVLLSEIILPMSPDVAAATQERAAAIAELRDFDSFSAAARRFSVAASRNEGGRLDWVPLSELPPQIAPLLLALQPGDVAGPVPLSGGLGLFQLRALEDRRPALGVPATIDHALMPFAPDADLPAEAARVRAEADRCDDLYAVFRDADPARLVRETAPRAELPAALATTLDRLDAGEIAILPPQQAGGGGALVMLCERVVIRDEDLSREDVRRQLFVRRLESLGDAFLAELRAAAFIETDR